MSIPLTNPSAGFSSIESSGVRGAIGEAISQGKLKGLAIMRSHGGRIRAIITGEAHIHADKAAAITGCLVPFPNYPAHIPMQRVDYICVVDEIGDPAKIATGAAKPTTDQRKLLMAEYCTQVVANTPFFKDGFSYQTGVGGASIASTISLTKIMEDRGIKMGFGVGGLTKPMDNLF